MARVNADSAPTRQLRSPARRKPLKKKDTASSSSSLSPKPSPKRRMRKKRMQIKDVQLPQPVSIEDIDRMIDCLRKDINDTASRVLRLESQMSLPCTIENSPVVPDAPLDLDELMTELSFLN